MSEQEAWMEPQTQGFSVIDPQARKAFYAALAKAQGAIEGAIKGNTNPHFRSKYADLGAVWDACREQLSANGLAVLQFPNVETTDKGMRVSVRTIITHEGGHSEEFVLPMPVAKPDAQGIGSAITYARRYALMAAIGIAPEDDDGNAAVQSTGNGTGYRANGKQTAAKSKDGKPGSWQAFISKLESFSDPDECERWFNAAGTQQQLAAWPSGDAGDWAALAADEYDKHMQQLYGKAS